MDAVVSTTTEGALKIVGHVVKRQVGYFFNYKEKFKELESYIEKLEHNKERLQHRVDNALSNAEEIENDIQHCLKKMDEKIKEYKSYINDKCHEKTICSISFFPNNFHLRYQLGRKATKMVEEIIRDELWKTSKIENVSFRECSSSDVAFSNTGYESFESRTRTMEMIMKALEDSTVDMIGVHGPGGVGKTTLVIEIAKKTREKKLFKTVVMANITRNPDIKKIQGQIADMLGMRLEEESEIARADHIRKRLKNEKENVLVILDDLWDGLDLNKLGIPCNDDNLDDVTQSEVNDIFDGGYNDDISNFGYNNTKSKKLPKVYLNKMKREKLSRGYKGGKILLTSRNKQVLCNQMDVQLSLTFSVGVLDEKEAETLLKKVADVKNSEFDGNATEIAKWSAGFPIALVSIGRTLRHKSLSTWEDVCQQIKRQSFTQKWGFTDFSIKLSYDYLKNEELKCIFLHCGRMGNDALVMDLVKFCFGLNLLPGVHTMTEARKRVKEMIHELEESSLLVRSYSIERFNMHDIVRDVALSISSKEKHVLFMKNVILDEWPHEDDFERYTAIFLHYCDINELPESIHCPRLEVLQIDNKNESLEIPDDFFESMIRLRVLVLTNVKRSCLPSSIKCLKKLRMLCLERCTLGENLSIIGELKNLRILTFSGSNIESLPLEFGQLDKLQFFDISNCSKLREITSNIIPKMNILEEFYIRDSLIQWEAEENIKSEKARLSELRHLNQLQNLDIHIQSSSHFLQNLFFDNLNSYKIVIGEFDFLNLLKVGEFKIPDKYEEVKFLALNLKEGIDIHSEKWVKMLFKTVECLLLGELNDVQDIFYELNVEGFPNLKHLSIANNFGIKYIINLVDQFQLLFVFPELESIWLYKMDTLEKICGNWLAETSFCCLKVIKIQTCVKLVNLFPFSMVRLLIALETIEVYDCDSLKGIVLEERQTHTVIDDKIEFPLLRILTLNSLPIFTCLYAIDKMSGSPQSLKDQQDRNKNIVTDIEHEVTNSCLPLFNEKVSIPKLEWLELSSINIQKIWSDQFDSCFQNLLTLNVINCGNLKYLLSLSMAGSLVNLQSLFVCKCEMMEDIFHSEDEEYIHVFPKLKKMEIICMEKLGTIWKSHIGLHSFCSLDSLIIRECHKLVTIFPSYMGQRFQSLHSLIITNCNLVENIFDFAYIPQTCDLIEANLDNIILEMLPNLVNVWKGDIGNILKYNNLRGIRVIMSPNLTYIFPLSVAIDLENLEVLEVWNCWAVKEIIAWERHSSENAINFKFPHLNTLSLIDLYELRSFYSRTHTLEWPPLKKLDIVDCSRLEGLTSKITNSQVQPIVLATKKVIYNLEYMSFSLKEAEWLQKYIVNVHIMHKLEELVLYGLKNNQILFWFLHRLPNLKRLKLGLCNLKRIWAPQNLISHEKIGVVMQLKELELRSIWPLEEIGFEHDMLLQRIECLIIQQCTKLRNLASSSIRFSCLRYLEVTNCMMRNLMTPSIAKTLVQLNTMKVISCPMIVEIVVDNVEEKVEEIEFKQLKSLELVSLQNLTSFSNVKNCDIKFPLLEKLVVSGCFQMTKFCELARTPNLQKIQVVVEEKEKWYWEGDLNTTLQKHFTYKGALEYSKHARLIDYPEMKGVRYGKPIFQDNLFNCLQKLEVDAACRRDILVPHHVLPYLKNVKELHVHSSDAVHVIFEIDETELRTKGIVFRLEKLTLTYLPNLKCVWNENPREIVNFPYLQEVYVQGCGSLVTLFPSSLAKNIEKLKRLQVLECMNLVAIVEKEDGIKHETRVIFTFPCLSILILLNMPLLSCFYLGKHHLECPLLDTLQVSYCPQLKLFTSNFDDDQKGVIEAPINPPQQPLFSIEILASSKLQNLQLNEENIMLLSDARLPQDLLHELKLLWLCFEDYNNEKGTLPFDFFHRVPNLEILVVQTCFGLKEIFPSEKLQVHDTVFKGLKQLFLNGLPHLEWVGLEHTWVQPYSEKLEKLSLYKCTQIERIVYYAVSFINLKEICVMLCERMEYLFTFATLKGLVKLETLIVEECESIKEIVKNEDEDGSDEMVFERLRLIQLNCLPRLLSFYSGNATLQCSCLNMVMVTECPNMTTFSLGIINVTSFKNIHTSIEDSDLLLENDLNTAIEKSFHTKDFYDYLKRMILDENLERTRVQHKNPVISINFFGSFKKLEFDATCKRVTVIPSHILPYLNNLEELNVHSSNAVQIIFDIDEGEVQTNAIVFCLKKFNLKNLSNLKCVWKESPRGIIICPNLQEVNVQGCGSLVTLFPSSIVGNLEKLDTLDISECEKMVEIVGREYEMEHGTTVMFEFPSLSFLSLENMALLSCFYPGKHNLECPLLHWLFVACCPKLKLFTPSFDDSIKEGVIEAPISFLQQPLFSILKVCPKLKGLKLNEENIKLMSDAHLPQDLLCNLIFLRLFFEDNNKEKDSLPFDFFHKVPNLIHLTVIKCFGLKEIFPSQEIEVHDKVLVRLKKLSLLKLNELEWVGFEHPWVQPYSEKLELLHIYECPLVEKIVSCAVSFINLQELRVKLCEKMEYLFTFATLKSLVKLETLSIKECESIKEIVKKEDEDGCDEKVFGRLRSIKLNSLPKLVSFYSGNATLQFSYLKNVMVAKCPNMKTFSEGVIKVPMFLEIKTSKDSDSSLHGDLNTTIQKLFHNQAIHQP